MKMFVRYLGNEVCWTLPDERFYIGERDELTEEERGMCEKGGGYLPVTTAINIVAS